MEKVGHWQSMMASFSHQATNEVIGQVPQSTKAEMDAAIASCKRAFPAWADTSVLSRQQVLLRYQQLIKENLVRHLNGIIFHTDAYGALVTPPENFSAAFPKSATPRHLSWLSPCSASPLGLFCLGYLRIKRRNMGTKGLAQW